MNNIPIGMIGLSHKTASVEVREKLSLNQTEYGDERVLFAQQLKNKFRLSGVFCLATCNRTEIYVSGIKYAGDLIRIQNFLLAYKNYLDDVDGVFYQHFGLDAVTHFFRVSSGLDSQIVGETQITAQVKDCLKLTQKHDFLDTLLNKMYSFGLQTNKKVRSETKLCDGAVSVSFAGVELARKIFGDLKNKNVLLIGAGETAELAAENFFEKNVKSISIVNRTLAKAQVLAEKFSAQAFDFNQLENCLVETDIVISATASDEPIISYDLMKRVFENREKHSEIFLIDLAIPRDIESTIDDIDEVFLYNLDDLNEIVDLNLEKRKREIPTALDIVEQYGQEFKNWKTGYSMSALISSLKDYFDNIRVSEINRLNSRLPQDKINEIEYLTESINNKILHQHIKTLKKSAVDPDLYRNYAEMLTNLYGLNK